MVNPSKYIVRDVRWADHLDVCRLIDFVDLPKSQFIKNAPEETMRIILHERSICVCEDDVMIAVVLVTNDNYIDTIISTRKGCGSLLLEHLPSGAYTAHVSPLNKVSIQMFRRAGFNEYGHAVISKQKRYIYAGNL